MKYNYYFVLLYNITIGDMTMISYVKYIIKSCMSVDGM